MKRAFLSRILVFALVLSMLPTSALADSAVSYADTQTHWAREAIDTWSGIGIIQGADGKFRPDDSITRGETAVILDRVMNYETKSTNRFADLGEDFYTDAMLKANAAGIILGDAGNIRPADHITREEAVVVLGRALGLAESTVSTATFADSAGISSWARGYVNAMVGKGYVQGADGSFNPKAPITRAEFITILNNIVAGIYSQAKTYSESVSKTVIVNVPGVILKDMTITGDLIIAEGVGDGDVTLNNVKVTGNVLVRGGGANSIHITGGSNIANIIIQKTDDGKIRIVTADGAVVDAVFVDDGSDDIILTGDFESVTIAGDVIVKAVDAQIDTLNITSTGAALTIDADSRVDALTVASTAAGASITVTGSIGTLTAGAKITVDNKGTITKAVVNADGVVVGGNKPGSVSVASSVTEEPVDDEGNPLVPTTTGGGGGGSTTPSMSVAVTKLATVAADANHDASAANQGAVTVAQNGNAVTVSGNLTNLSAFASTVSAQGTHKWVGLVVDTGFSSIIGVKYNDVALTAADVADAASVGIGAGKFVHWVKADEIALTAKTFTLSKSGYSTKTMTVAFTDTAVLTGVVTKLGTVANDINFAASTANQGAVTVTQDGAAVTVTGDIGALNTFASTAGQGDHKWVGLAVDTGMSSIIGVEFNGAALTEADVAEAASVDVGAGKFVLWIKADEVVATAKTFTLSKTGKTDKTVTVSVVDTKPLTGAVSKLTTVAADANAVASAANQGAVTVAQNGNAVTVSGNLTNLSAFASTVSAQGTHKWVGLVVATGQTSITGVKYNDADLTAADVTDAASVSVGAGSFVLWVKADEVVSTPKTFTLSQAGRVSKTVTVSFTDTAVLTGAVTKLGTVANDINHDASAANQAAVEVTQDGAAVTVTGDIGALNTFASTAGQGDHKWVGLAVDTGMSSIIGVEFNGVALTEADVAEAASVDVGAGKFVLWIKADEVVSTAKTFTLSKTGKTDKTITVSVVDTAPLTGAVSKLTTVAADANHDASAANQGAVTVAQNGTAVTISGNLTNLSAFASTVSAQGTHKWIGLVVATGQTSIIGVKYNDADLTAADVADAASVSVGAGSFVLWVKADEVVSTPKTFTLSQAGRVSKTVTVSFTDTAVLTGAVTKLGTVANDTNHDASTANQGAVTVTQDGAAVTVTGDIGALNTFASTAGQGDHKWVGLAVDTGMSSIIGVEFNGVALTEADVAEAASVDVGAGKFVLWIKADEVIASAKTFTLSKAGKTDKTVTVSVVDTAPLTGAVSKLTTVAADANHDASAANQGAVTVAQNGNAVTISGNLTNLSAFASTVGAQGTHKWIGLVVATGQTSIIGVKYEGADLTAADVTDAASVSVGAGSFVLWVKADEVVSTPKTFTLSQAGRVSKTVTVSFTDTAVLTGAVTKLGTVTNDINFAASTANQGAVTVTQDGAAVTVTGDIGALNTFASTAGQGDHKWVGLAVDTGMSSIIGVEFNGVALTEADVAEAASVGVGAGKFVLWIKADEVVSTAKVFTLSKAGKTDKTITVNCVDNNPLTGAVSKLTTVAADANAVASAANQGAVTVAQLDDAAIISGNLGALNSFTSTVEAQGTHKWVGLVVATGQTSIIGVKYNDADLTAVDVADAASVNVEAGSFVLWVKADEIVSTPKTFTLSQDGRVSKTITINFVDTTPLSGAVTKLATVAADANAVVSAANQGAVTVAQNGGAVTITGDIGALNTFESTVSAQGAHKWVGLVVDTGMSSIIGVEFNGAALTEADVAEAASVDVGAGKFVLWIKADEVVSTAKTFTLSKTGKTDKTITVSVVDTAPLTGAVSKLTTVAADTNAVVSAANQGAVTVAQDGTAVTVSGNLADLNSFASTVSAQGTHKWIGLVVATGQTSIIGVKYNDADLTAADVADAASVSVGAGSFVLWIKADEVVSTPKTFTLSQAGRADKEITVTFDDTTPVAAVSNIHYVVANGDVHLEFTRPTDTSNIAKYLVEFSTNGGTTWGNSYEVGTPDGQFASMGDLALSLTTTTTFNKVRVTSVAATGYTDNAATDDDSFTFTVSETAVGFNVTKNADNQYTIGLTNAAVNGELYSIKITKATGAPNYYPLGYVFTYDSIILTPSSITLAGAQDYEIVDGSLFEVRKITGVFITDTDAGMTVSKKVAPVAATPAP